MTVERINKSLKARYGCNLKGQPNFRLVFSSDQREKRFGTFTDYSGALFVRQVSEIREVPKYPICPNKWLLERWMPPELAYTAEIPDTINGSYEPVYFFQDEGGFELPINEEVIERIIYHLFHPILPGDRASRDRSESEQTLADEIAQNVEILEDQGRSWIGHQLHSKEAIIKP